MYFYFMRSERALQKYRGSTSQRRDNPDVECISTSRELLVNLASVNCRYINNRGAASVPSSSGGEKAISRRHQRRVLRSFEDVSSSG